MPAKRVGEVRHVGDARVRDDQLHACAALDERVQVGGDRRQSAAAVDEDRHAALARKLEHGREPLVLQRDLLRARMQLDPAGAGVDAAVRLGDRILVQVEADERDQPAVRLLRVGERAVVRRAEARVAVGLVEAEHESAADAVVVHHPEQFVRPPAHAVDVVAEVYVGVEDLDVLR